MSGVEEVTELERKREIAKLFGLPEHIIGIPTPWWRRWWQRHVTRRK